MFRKSGHSVFLYKILLPLPGKLWYNSPDLLKRGWLAIKQDLTQGSIFRKLLLYFLPIAAGTLFQQLYNAVDAVIVGKFVGTEALAAVAGSAANVTNVIIGFFVALSGGCSVIIAQIFGAKNEEQLPHATGTAVAFCMLAGVALSAIGYLSAPVLLEALKTPPETMAGSILYLRIVFLGVTAQLLYNIEAGILRAVGDSRSPFLYLFLCCFVNIGLDLLFVIGFHMGVAGVAIATVISQALSAVLATRKLVKTREAYGIRLKHIRFHPRLLKKMMGIGIPAGLQSSMYTVSNLLLQVGVNTLGTVSVASWALCGKLDGFYWAVINAGGVAITNFVAQNYGAGREDRIRKCRRISLWFFVAVTEVISLVFLTVGKLVFPLFSNDPAVIELSYQILLYFVPVYVTWTFVEVYSGLLRGVGDAVNPTIISGLGIALFRVLWVWLVFPLRPTMFIISICYPITWSITGIALFLYARSSKWKRLVVRQKELPAEP